MPAELSTVTGTRPVVFQWGEDLFVNWEAEVNTDSIIECADWIKKFSGNHRLPNDVGLPLERCVIGSYQIGYLYDYVKIVKEHERIKYMEEGIASVLLHIIASYEMTGREYVKLFNPLAKYYWNQLVACRWSKDSDMCLYNIARSTFQFQRWMLYNHMGRTKRWNEGDYQRVLIDLTLWCCSLANVHRCDLALGFAMAMEKLQDQEIKRH